MNGGKYAPPIWTIDGAPFQVDIPTFQMWQSVKPFWEKHKPKIPKIPSQAAYKNYFLLRTATKITNDGIYLVLPDSKTDLHGEFDDNNKKIAMYVKFTPSGEQITERVTIMGVGLVFTVCLTPLDSNGEDDSFQFSMDNPDGSIFQGGTLYVDENPVVGVHGFDPRPRVPDGKSVYIGDTYPTYGNLAALDWVVYNGKLMAPYNLFSLCLQDVQRVFNGYRKIQ